MCEARYAPRDGSYGLCSLLVYQLVGAGASLLLESAHFLHGSEQRVAAQFGVHLVKHFAPERLGNVAAACDWTKAATWTFEPLDNEAFPAVNLARHCLESSEKHTAVLNAANEQAVHAFLEHRLPYLGIVDTVREVLDEMDAELRGNPLFASVEEMSRLEQEARARADKLINK